MKVLITIYLNVETSSENAARGFIGDILNSGAIPLTWKDRIEQTQVVDEVVVERKSYHISKEGDVK